MSSSRFSRFTSIVTEEDLRNLEPIIIGVGAIGRQVALTLASMGVGCLHLVDFDHVEEPNLGTQGYCPSDLGKLKTEATAQRCQEINPECRIWEHPDYFLNSNIRTQRMEVYFSCVDSMEARKDILEGAYPLDLFIDGRMSAETLQVYTVNSDDTYDQYLRDWFPDDQAHGNGCTQQSTYYCAQVAAGMMVSQMTKWMRKFPLEYRLEMNILAAEMVA